MSRPIRPDSKPAQEPLHTRVYRTTLLDLLQGIDEFAGSEQESLATALRLLQGGRFRLVTRTGDLGDEPLLGRARLRDLLEAESRAIAASRA